MHACGKLVGCCFLLFPRWGANSSLHFLNGRLPTSLDLATIFFFGSPGILTKPRVLASEPERPVNLYVASQQSCTRAEYRHHYPALWKLVEQQEATPSVKASTLATQQCSQQQTKRKMKGVNLEHTNFNFRSQTKNGGHACMARVR